MNMPNSSPIDRREEVEKCDLDAVATYIAGAFGEKYRQSVLRSGRWPDLTKAFAAHRLAERERCAGEVDRLIAIADANLKAAHEGLKSPAWLRVKRALAEAATAIRSPNP